MVVQGRNQDYIKSVTTEHLDLLDPAGRAARVDPSQITDIQDYSYGLGKSSRIPSGSMKRIIERIRSSLDVEKDDFGEYQRLISGLQKATGPNISNSKSGTDNFTTTDSINGQSNEAKAHANALNKLARLDGDLPGAQGPAVAVNLSSAAENTQLLKLTVEEVGPLSVQGSAGTSGEYFPKYPPVKQSKFEIDAFERAKARQRTFIDDGTVQIAGGWEFKGNSFASKPAEIEFKDFLVGKKYKKRFTLTNVSYTFNSFKILSLSDDVIDFFEISYEKPGRMSAGVSCVIDITFTPKVNEDIFSYIPLSTATGPIRIPLRCLIQRCAPKVQAELIDFGQIVIGEKQYKSIKIVNTQAIGTSFKVTLKPPVIIKTQEEIEAEQLAAKEAAEIAAVLKELEDNVSTTLAAVSAAKDSLEVAMKQKDKKVLAAAQSSLEEATKLKETADQAYTEFQVRQKEKKDEAAMLTSAVESQDESSDADIEIGDSPALNDGELMARVRNVITSTLRRKKKENPTVFSVVKHPSMNDLSPHRIGLLVCDINPVGEIIPQTSTSEEFYIDGYSECIVAFLCSPLTTDMFEDRFVFTFDKVPRRGDGTVDSKGEIITREQSVTIKAQGTDLSIYLVEDTVDLKCTLHDRIYRKRIEIRNRARTAYRVNFVIPPKLQKYIDVNPPMLFVQGGSSQEVNFKFSSSFDIVKHLAHFSRFYDEFDYSAMLAYPLQLQVVNQSLPVFCTIKSDYTSSTLKFSKVALDFGKVYVNQKTTVPIAITNLSMLPQKIAAVKLKKELNVDPNDGFTVLLPNETIIFQVSFSPSSAIVFDISLCIMTSLNDTYNISVRGEGIEPPVEISSAVIKMRGTCPGERVIENVFFKNNTSKQQMIELLPPSTHFSWIKFSPTVLDLAPGESQRVEVDFNPPSGLIPLDASEWYQKKLSVVEGKSESPFTSFSNEGRWTVGTGLYGTIQWANISSSNSASCDAKDDEESENASFLRADLEPSDWGIVGRWNIPILIYKKQKLSNASMTTNSAILYVSVETVVNLPELEVDTTDIDFGQSAIGIRMTKMVKIRNRTNRIICLSQTQILNAVGPFSVLNFVRELQPGASIRLLFNCIPTTPTLCIEQLILASPDLVGHQIRFTLKVQGVNPTVEISGLTKALGGWGGPLGGILDFGNVVATDLATKKFVVLNKSDFPVNMSITRAICEDLSPFIQSKLISRSADGLPLFSYRPELSIIAPGTSREVEVIFRSDRGRAEPFREDLHISVGQADGTIKVCLIGRAVDRQIFVTPSDPLGEPFYKSMSSSKGTAITEGEETVSLLSGTEFDDIFGEHSNVHVRKLTAECRVLAGLGEKLKDPTKIKLEFPDPFADDVNPSAYITVEAGANGGGKAPAKGAPAAVPSSSGLRQQSRKLTIICAKINDGRANSSAGGAYEVQLSPAATASGLFKLVAEKGNIAVGAEAVIEVLCALPMPKGIGGLQVGSWQTFDANVVLKGGWKKDGTADECIVPFSLSAFVRL